MISLNLDTLKDIISDFENDTNEIERLNEETFTFANGEKLRITRR